MTIAGDVKDNAGTHKFAQYAPKEKQPRNLKRVYNFESIQKLNAYLGKTNQCIQTSQGKRFFNLTEYIADRITGEVKGIVFRVEVKGSGGRSCGSSSRVSQNIENEKASFLRIAPNPPKNGILKLTQQGNTSLKIVDVLRGTTLKTIAVKSTQMFIDISDLPSGIYLLVSDQHQMRFVIE